MSAELIQRLKTSHQDIVNKVDQVGILLRSYTEAKPYIREMNAALLLHFGWQDGVFKRLLEFYKDDRQATKRVEFLMHDLQESKVQFLTFFDKYTGEMADAGSRNFPRDFNGFSRQVLTRLKIEEEYLFPLLERLP